MNKNMEKEINNDARVKSLIGPLHFTRSVGKNLQSIIISLILVGAFTSLEIVYGILSKSMLLIADAMHMSSDFLSLLLALIGILFGTKKSNTKKTFGYTRLEIIMAFVNVLSLLVIAIFIIVVSIKKFFVPDVINSNQMFYVALIGLLVNIVMVLVMLFNKKGQFDLVMRSVFLHVLSDVLGSLVAVLAALFIKYSNFYIIDPVLSIFISILFIRHSVKIMVECANILMNSTPKDIKIEKVKDIIEKTFVNKIKNAHHIHVFMIDAKSKIISVHISVYDNLLNKEITELQKDVKILLLEKFGIVHSTIQLEYSDICPDIVYEDSNK
jgi:cobalt-zinc-cadmium efflux system protein